MKGTFDRFLDRVENLDRDLFDPYTEIRRGDLEEELGPISGSKKGFTIVEEKERKSTIHRRKVKAVGGESC